VKTAFPIVKLSEIARLNPTLGGRLPEDELVSFVPMASMSAETAKVETTQDRPYFEVSKGFTPFLSGDVLIAKITPCFENGKIAQANLPRRNGFGSTEFHVVRSRPDLSDARYLHHYLRLKDVRTEGQRRMTGSGGQRRVPASFLSELRIPAPSVAEQHRIAAILDQAETLRTQRRAALAQLDSLTQSIFLDMFDAALASKDRIPMGVLVSEFRYGTSEKSGDSGFPALRIPNVTSGSLDLNELKTVVVEVAEFERLRLVSGDLLFVRTNGNPDYVGRCAVFEPFLVVNTDFEPTEFIYASYLIRARLKGDDLLPLVLQYYLSEGEGRRALRARCKTSAGQYNINTVGLCSIPIPLFPLALQQTFATRIQAIESLKTTHRTALTDLDALFASLQQRAFAGEL
jgi:type I restriction enzyme, S subunit